MLQWVHHVPVWVPAELPVDAEGNTRPGFICVHELENGRGSCGGNVFSLDQEVGDHACLVDEENLISRADIEPRWVNWRTVNIIGRIAADEIEAAQDFLTIDLDTYGGLGPLSFTNGFSGLGNWVDSSRIKAWGNLAERGYSVEDVAEHLRQLVKVAPSLAVLVHCGGDYESRRVVATIITYGGEVRVKPPSMDFLWWSFDDDS